MATKYRVTAFLEEPETGELAAVSGKHRVSLAWSDCQAIPRLFELHQENELPLPGGLKIVESE